MAPHSGINVHKLKYTSSEPSHIIVYEVVDLIIVYFSKSLLMKFCLTAVLVRLEAKVPKLVISVPPK